MPQKKKNRPSAPSTSPTQSFSAICEWCRISLCFTIVCCRGLRPKTTECGRNSEDASLKLLPGSTVRWRGQRYLIVDYQSLDAIVARQPGKRRLERIPVNEAAPDHASHIVSGRTPDLVSVPEEAWQRAVKRFEILKPLLNMGNSERTFVHVKKAARALGKHPSTIYRWIEKYERSERLSVFLRKSARIEVQESACHNSREA